MLKRVKNNEPPKILRGREVIEEAARFLRQIHFHANRGAFAEGKHVAVLVDPRWNEGNETIRLLITCYAFGHRRVDWEGLPVFVEPQNRGDAWLCFLNGRGQGIIPDLPPGDYRLSTSAQFGRSAAPVPFLTSALALAAAPKVGQDVICGPHVYESTDGRLRATLRQTMAGTTVVAVETNEASLAGAVVRFAFVQETGKIQLTDTVTLQPVEGEAGLCEGRWERLVSVVER
ncbi:MAG: hypothetical protein RMK49_18940, partial [Abditibacteriales bacterium]|nr:hypothetical protein [Abditibacteriales bacterium]